MSDPHIRLEHPSDWVARFALLIPDGEVLDLACGGGRHSRFLAARGYRLFAVDRDAAALSTLPDRRIRTLQVDLEGEETKALAETFEHGRYAAVVVTNYLHRPLFQRIIDSLGPNGVLIYETFAQGNERFGKPSNADFLLRPGELLSLANLHPMRVIAYEDGYIGMPKPAMVQRICAIKALIDVDPSSLRLI